jgi:hypothetical protein
MTGAGKGGCFRGKGSSQHKFAARAIAILFLAIRFNRKSDSNIGLIATNTKNFRSAEAAL